MLTKNSSFLLTKDDFEQADHLPDWLLREYKTFSETVTDPTFPCFFGMTAQRRGELRYSYIEHDKWDHLPEAVESFLSLFTRKIKRDMVYSFLWSLSLKKINRLLSIVFLGYSTIFT